MPYSIEDKLVVAIASSALFDLTESDKVFREQGEDAYRTFQRQHEEDILCQGVAFPFIKRLLSLNDCLEGNPVEVILLSKNDADTGLRVFNSIEHFDLNITRAAFLNGGKPYTYIPSPAIRNQGAMNARTFRASRLATHFSFQVFGR